MKQMRPSGTLHISVNISLALDHVIGNQTFSTVKFAKTGTCVQKPPYFTHVDM